MIQRDSLSEMPVFREWPGWMKLLAGFTFWTLVGLLFSVQFYLLELSWDMAIILNPLKIAMPRWYLWGLLTPLIIQFDRRFLAHWSLPKRLLAHIPSGLLWAFVVIVLVFVVHRLLGFPWPERPVLSYSVQYFWDIIIYGLIVGVSMAWHYAGEVQQRDLRASQMEQLITEARLHALQSQLNPHFLFNALNTISAYIESEPRTARHIMAQLGGLLRFSLDFAERMEIRLEEELHFLSIYLEIERLRFEDRLTVTVDVDPEVLNALVPGFLLQPLVENAVRHGISQQKVGGQIEVSARRVDNTLLIRVRDNGAGLPEGWKLDKSEGVGLRNLTERLDRRYGKDYHFHIKGSDGQGVLIEVMLPYQPATVQADRYPLIEEARTLW